MMIQSEYETTLWYIRRW